MKNIFATISLLLSLPCVQAIEFVKDERTTEEFAANAVELKSKEKWLKFKPRSYYYILAYKGWMNYFPLVTVYVYENKVVKVDNIHPFMNKDMNPVITNFNTIDELIKIAQRASKKENSYFNLRYNSTFGYPEYISFWPKDKHHGGKEFNIVDFSAIKKSNKD